jgi:hypothetical protein
VRRNKNNNKKQFRKKNHPNKQTTKQTNKQLNKQTNKPTKTQCCKMEVDQHTVYPCWCVNWRCDNPTDWSYESVSRAKYASAATSYLEHDQRNHYVSSSPIRLHASLTRIQFFLLTTTYWLGVRCD